MFRPTLLIVFTTVIQSVNAQQIKAPVKHDTDKKPVIKQKPVVVKKVKEPTQAEIDAAKEQELLDKGFVFYEGLATARSTEKSGYINKKGEWVIYPNYEEVMPFSGGFARVKKEGKWGFIDKSG